MKGSRVLCLSRGHILLVEHRDPISHEHYWVLPGGGRDDGETLAETAKREVREETGVEVRIVRRLRVPATQPNVTYALFLAEAMAHTEAEPQVDIKREAYLRGAAWHPVSEEHPIGPLSADYWGYLAPRIRRLLRAKDKAMAPVPPKEAPTLTDGVVTLNSYQLSDVEAHLAGDDIENQKWLNDSHASSIETVTGAICNWRRDWQTGAPRRAWAIRDPTSQTLLGGCELRMKDDAIAELSYWIFPQHRGHGYAARAVRLVVDHAFAHLGIERAEIHFEVDNAASRGVARQAGFVEEGVLRKKMIRGGQRRDLVMTSRLKDD